MNYQTLRHPLFSLVATSLLVGAPLSAQSGKLAPDTSEQMLKTLKDLEGQLGGAKSRKVAEALKAFETAAASGDKAYNLWIDCKKSVDFDEKGKNGGDWGEWKRGEGSQYHEPESTTAMQHQLKWLILTIKACNAEKEAEMAAIVQQVPGFLDAMLGDWKKMKQYSRSLRDSVISSPFGRFYKLDLILPMPKNWSDTPGNLDAIFDNTILSHFRDTKALAPLTAAWQKRIAMTTEIHEIEVQQEKSAENDPKAYVPKAYNPGKKDPQQPGPKPKTGDAEERMVMFKKEGLPTLQWGMSVDAYRLGAESASANAMLGLIRSNLGHPSAGDWLVQLQALIKGDPAGGAVPAAPATPTPADAPAPAAPAAGN